MANSRQFTDHNEVGGANIYLEDKRLAERTAVGSAAGIANLKFLLANDDTEGFNTAIKAYIDEAVRSAIGTLVDNLDKNTAISRILATDSNHDLGTITPANLASVLGVKFTIAISSILDSNDDLSSYKNPGMYWVRQFAGIVVGNVMSSSGTLIVFSGTEQSGFKCQLFVGRKDSIVDVEPVVFVRTTDAWDNTYHEWKLIG